MLKMNPEGGGRRTDEEIVAAARDEYGIDLVSGCAEVLEMSRATRERGWVASFTDARCAYYVHMNGTDDLVWQTHPVPADSPAEDVVFVLSVGTGYGSVFPQPSGQFDLDLNEKPLLSFCVAKENRRWEGGGATLHYDIKRLQVGEPNVPLCMDAHVREESMASYGLMFLRAPKRLLTPGQPAMIRVTPRSGQPSRRWFKLDVERFARPLLKCNIEDGLAAACADRRPPTSGDFHVYFGDIHVHTGEEFGSGRTCGTGTLEENYRYARDVAGLDILAIAEHDWQMTGEDEWRRRMEINGGFEEPGRFVCLPCFEWTSLKYGHRNVYYRDGKWPYFDSSERPNTIGPNDDSPADLWRRLRECGARAITVAHHTSTGFFPVDWSYWDPEFDRLVEVYSTWGNSECYGAPHPGWAADRHPGMGALDALLRGRRLGLIASSDGHDGHPGNAQWSQRQPHIHHHLGSGFIAVLAPELTRDAVFDAMYARRCYATTGTRIALDFRVNGSIMGSEITAPSGDDARIIYAKVIGTADLATIEVVRDGESLDLLECRGREVEVEIEDASPIQENTFYYVRVVQTDGEMAWSSPVWVDAK